MIRAIHETKLGGIVGVPMRILTLFDSIREVNRIYDQVLSLLLCTLRP